MVFFSQINYTFFSEGIGMRKILREVRIHVWVALIGIWLQKIYIRSNDAFAIIN